MVVFPLAKVVILAVKQISKPVSIMIKAAAKYNPRIRKYLCVAPGQMYNRLEARSKLYMLNLPQPESIPRIPDSMAAQLGADLLGELVVLGIGLYLIYYEVSRQALKEEKKHEKHKKREEELQEKLRILSNHIKQQEQELYALRQMLNHTRHCQE